MYFDTHLTLSQAYRPFFPLAALMSAVSVLAWICSLNGFVPLPPHPTLWHAHEMLFGFATAVILGFVLTAAKNWTGQQPITRSGLGALIFLWLAARLFGLWPGVNAQLLSAACDIPVLFLGTGYVARVLIRTKNTRNLMFIPFLLGLALANLTIHYSLWTGNTEWAKALLHGAAGMVGFLMVFMGGRVIPFFSGRRLSYGTKQFPAVNWVSTLSALACAFFISLNQPVVLGFFAMLAALSTAVRWLLWSPWRSIREPMLWILHLGYLWLVLAYAFMALIELQLLPWPKTASIHALLTGGLGCLGLGMINRVSLGHSGRAIAADGWIVTSFYLVVLAGFLRMSVYVFQSQMSAMYLTLSALCWSAAFAVFALRHIRCLWSSAAHTASQTSV